MTEERVSVRDYLRAWDREVFNHAYEHGGRHLADSMGENEFDVACWLLHRELRDDTVTDL